MTKRLTPCALTDAAFAGLAVAGGLVSRIRTPVAWVDPATRSPRKSDRCGRTET
jgi:hypothetical protein